MPWSVTPSTSTPFFSRWAFELQQFLAVLDPEGNVSTLYAPRRLRGCRMTCGAPAFDDPAGVDAGVLGAARADTGIEDQHGADLHVQAQLERGDGLTASPRQVERFHGDSPAGRCCFAHSAAIPDRSSVNLSQCRRQCARDAIRGSAKPSDASLNPPQRFPARTDRPLRRAVLRHLAAGGGEHGPAAAAASVGRRGGVRGRRHFARPAGQLRYSRLAAGLPGHRHQRRRAGAAQPHVRRNREAGAPHPRLVAYLARAICHARAPCND